jgi:hypothetical protein
MVAWGFVFSSSKVHKKRADKVRGCDFCFVKYENEYFVFLISFLQIYMVKRYVVQPDVTW